MLPGEIQYKQWLSARTSRIPPVLTLAGAGNIALTCPEPQRRFGPARPAISGFARYSSRNVDVIDRRTDKVIEWAAALLS